MERRVKTNPLQWSVFLDFAEKHPETVTRKFSSVGSKHKYNELWKEISSHLNSMGFQQKTVDKWQKAITDWKSKVKAKAADINRGMAKTGGGGPMAPLNENEERLLAILGWTSVKGHNVQELGVAITDWKSKVKAKAADINRGMAKTGGGGPMAPLNENEERLLAILGWTSVKGHNVQELGVNEISSAAREAVPDENMEEIVEEIVVDEAEVIVELPLPSTPLPPELITIHKAAPPEPMVPPLPSTALPLTTSKKAAPSQSQELTPKKKKIKTTKTMTPSAKKKTEIQIFQEQTLSVLNTINSNLSRMADAQEKMCSILENMKKS